MYNHILACLLFFQSFVACQQGPAEVQPLATANIGFASMAANKQCLEKARPSATNIVFRSADGGQTWQDVSAGLPENTQVQEVFASGSDLFLGGEKGVYRSSSPFAAPVWEQEILLTGRITDVSPGRTSLYACSYGSGLFQKILGTPIWEGISNTLKDKTVRTVLESPDGTVLVGTDTGIFKSANGGQTWKQVFANGMVLDLVAANGILIAGGRQGVLRSTDGGEHWDAVLNEHILAKKTSLLQDRFVTILGTKDPSQRIQTVLPASDSVFVTILGTENPSQVNPEGITSRLRASTDGGKTWQRMESALGPVQGIYNMDERLTQVKDVYDIVQVGESLFCSFDTGIFRSADQGKTWELVLPSRGKLIFRLAVSGGVIYAVPGAGGC